MKVFLNVPLKTIEGEDLKNERGLPLTLLSAAVVAMTMPDQEAAGEEKQRRYELAQKLFSGEVEMTIEEVALLKRLIAKAYPSPLVAGQAWHLLESSATLAVGKDA